MNGEANIIQSYLNEAHNHLTEAEELMNEGKAKEVLLHCRKAVAAVFEAFLIYRGEECGKGMGIDQLFSCCAALEDEFYSLEDLLAFLTMDEDVDELDEEDLAELVDAANEIWDFVLSFLPEKYYL